MNERTHLFFYLLLSILLVLNDSFSLSGDSRWHAHCRRYHSDQSLSQEISVCVYVYLLYKALHGSVGKLGPAILYGIPAARERHLFSINAHYKTH